jgi:hypothetical protein
VADPYVQSLITDAAAVFLQRGMGIVVGSFVRILNSEYRGYCGYVTSIDGTMGIVQIEYLDRLIIVTTPVRNLKDLSYVPADRKVFFFCKEVEELDDVALLVPYLHYVEEIVVFDETKGTRRPGKAQHPISYTRNETTTGYVRILISEGWTNPHGIARLSLTKIASGGNSDTGRGMGFLVCCCLRNFCKADSFGAGILTFERDAGFSPKRSK